MPVRSVIYKEQRLVVAIEEGRVTFEDMLANQNRLLNNPDFDPGFNQLSDATLATDTDFSAQQSRHALRAPNLLVYFTTSRNRSYLIHLRNGANARSLRRVIE